MARKRTFEKLMQDRLDEFKVQAATLTTYGDYWELEGELQEELCFLKRVIAEDRRKIRKDRKQAEHWAWMHNPILVAHHNHFADELEAKVEGLAAIRDEMRAGLRQIKRDLEAD